jgi:hypothetical protein
MELISCDNCAVTLDKNKLLFLSKSRLHKDNGEIDTDKFEWDGDKYVAKVSCPICSYDILEE